MYRTKTTFSGTTINGSKAFGHLSSTRFASDYITNKKATLISCHSKTCLPKTRSINQSIYLSSKKTNYIKYSNPQGTNKNQLASGLITTIDLLDVPVIQNNNTGESPSTISTSSIPYLSYVIDPSGVMFGNNICGLNNINDFRVINS